MTAEMNINYNPRKEITLLLEQGKKDIGDAKKGRTGKLSTETYICNHKLKVYIDYFEGNEYNPPHISGEITFDGFRYHRFKPQPINIDWLMWFLYSAVEEQFGCNSK